MFCIVHFAWYSFAVFVLGQHEIKGHGVVLKLLQGDEHALVHLVPKQWIPFHTFELCIMHGDVPILTDYGYARLEISRLQIDFGSTTYGHSGSIERFLSKKVSEAVGNFLLPHQFTLAICDKMEHFVRFTLMPVGAPMKELRLSTHFETSWATFHRAMGTETQHAVEPSDIGDEMVA